VLKSKYGIDIKQYQTMLNAQSGSCALCEKSDDLCVDHCHETGKVRGLLCRQCNSAIGKLGDNAAGLQRALSYLS
jgi:coenzyme F420-reducing hydrogenase beta subunit